MTVGEPRGVALTLFQLEVARVFFALPASRGFLLAGGAALAAHRLTTRPTRDLDLFASPGAGQVVAARDEFEAVARSHGLAVMRVRDTDTFCRLLVSGRGQQELLVDLALDSTPGEPGVESVAGPTFALPELAGRKVVALFDRAEARDFADVFALAKHFSQSELLEQARLVDRGFDDEVFAQMMQTLSRFNDVELPIPADEAGGLRAFFARWASELAEHSS